MALREAVDWMVVWEDGYGGKSVIAAAHAYAAIALAAGQRLARLQAEPDE